MKIWKSILQISFLILVTTLLFLEPTLANQLVTKMSVIRNNLTDLAQACAGIGIVVGLILVNMGSHIGKIIMHGSVIGFLVTFLLPAVLNFLESVGR